MGLLALSFAAALPALHATAAPAETYVLDEMWLRQGLVADAVRSNAPGGPPYRRHAHHHFSAPAIQTSCDYCM